MLMKNVFLARYLISKAVFSKLAAAVARQTLLEDESC